MTTFPVSSGNDPLVARVAANLAVIKERVASASSDPSRVRVVAVTKGFDVAYVEAAASLGLDTVGENYVEELCAKREQSRSVLRWHFLGALQTNKIARALRCADVLCGVSRDKEIRKIAQIQAGASIYVQVDFTGVAERNGAPPSYVAALVGLARGEGLDVRGLMTVAPPEPEGARRAFRATVDLADELSLRERSMGMSDDFEMACHAGSTEIRLGRALFGPRVSP